MKRIPRKLKKKIKTARIKHFEALLKSKGVTFKEWINMSKEEFKKRFLTEWHTNKSIKLTPSDIVSRFSE
jgi:polyphosphate kinase 2 (PPK2 family)